jgi:ABC-2 type transport system permease protein
MRAFAAQVHLLLIEHLRLPAYLAASTGFPTVFFLIFAVPEAKEEALANFLLASFLGFAILGVMFLQFAHGIAEERSSAWYTYLRTLPLPTWTFFGSRILVAWFVALLTAVTLSVVAVMTTPVSLSLTQWLKLYTVLIVAGLPFALMGLAMGVWVSEKVALPLGNLVYLPLTYAGGLMKPPEMLPKVLQEYSVYLPTRCYGNLLWAVTSGGTLEATSMYRLLYWSAVFFAIAALGRKVRRRV